MVGAAHERPRLDVPEAQSQGDFPEFGEFGGGVVPGNGPVTARRLLVLADRDALAADDGQVVEQGDDGVPGLAQADHEAGLADDVPVRVKGGQQPQGAFVVPLGDGG